MGTQLTWPVAQELRTARLTLEPLRVEHAQEAYAFMKDERIHAFTGWAPQGLNDLRARFERQVAGHAPDGSAGWVNWMLRHPTGRLLGTVQATVHRHPDGGLEAHLGWVLAFEAQGHGFARESVSSMVIWLMGCGVKHFAAFIHPRHTKSKAVARSVGLHPTRTMVDGEIKWTNGILDDIAMAHLWQ